MPGAQIFEPQHQVYFWKTQCLSVTDFESLSLPIEFIMEEIQVTEYLLVH